MKGKFPPPVIAALEYYVYVYSHPVTKEVFYIGKGRGNRVFDHLKDIKDSLKLKYIQNLSSEGLKPQIEILIHGIDEETALRVEAAVIDLIGRDNLTNVQKGHKSATHGRLNVRQIISMYERTRVDVTDPVIAFRINQHFYPTIPPDQLYDITRSQWDLNSDRASRAKYAFAVYEGIIQEVYTILAWFDGGTTFTSRDNPPMQGRREFVGRIAEEKIRNKYLYMSIEHLFQKGAQNPVKYFNVD